MRKIFWIAYISIAFLITNYTVDAQVNKDKKAIELQSNDWFDYNTQYLKITTKEEGVAKIKVSDILEIYPEWKNELSDYLRLVKNGISLPFYLVDANKQLSNDDIIYFWGSFPHGDSTYYDFYTAREAHFLFIDKENGGQRLSLIENPTNNSSKITSVEVDRYISEPVNFAVSDNYKIYDEWNSLYIWDEITAILNENDKYFNTHQFILPPDDGNKTNTDLHYQPEFDSTSNGKPRYFRLRFYLNEEKFDTKNYIGRFFGYSRADENYISGINRVTLGTELQTATAPIFIDYLNIHGYEKPYALKGKTAFKVNDLQVDSYVEIPGFYDAPVAIDTLNSTIYFPESEQGTFLTAGASINTEGLLSITINHKQAFYDKRGILIGYYKEDSLYYQLYDKDNINILEFLEAAGSSPLAISCNMETNLSTNILDKIETMTNCDMSSISGDISWALIYDNDTYQFENNEFIASVNGFIANSNGAIKQAKINLKAGNHRLFVNDQSTIEIPRIDSVNQSRLSYTNQQADVIILSHRKFIKAANMLADYRREQLDLSIKVIDVDDIYNEYNFGRQSPYPIKEFLDSAYYNWRTPGLKYLILFGDANIDHTMRLKKTNDNNYIPSYGVPFSDNWYAMINREDELHFEFTIGRIPANTEKEAIGYVNKLIDYDNMLKRPWMKRFLFLSGGQYTDESENLYGVSSSYMPRLANPPLGVDTMIISNADGTKPEVLADSIINTINEGVMWANYLGHGASNVFDMDGWNVEFLNNNKKYGVLSTMACNTGHFSVPDLKHARNESYMMAPDRGFIASFGASWGSMITPSNFLMNRIWAAITDQDVALRRLGDIIVYAKNGLHDDGMGGGNTSTRLYFHLLGDPLIELKLPDQTDLLIANEDFSILSNRESITILESDEYIKIDGTIYNLGYMPDDSVTIELKHEYNEEVEYTTHKIEDLRFDDKLFYQIPITDKPGIHTFTITLDPQNEIDETTKENNAVVFSVEVFKEGVLPLEPMPLWDISNINPIVRVINPDANNEDKTFTYQFQIDEFINGEYQIFYESKNDEILISDNYIQWAPQVELTDGNNYTIKIKTILEGKSKSNWLELPVTANAKYKKNAASFQYNSLSQTSNLYLENIEINVDSNLNLRLQDTEISYDLVSFHKDNEDSFSQHYGFFKIGDIIYIAKQQSNRFYMMDIPMDASKDIGTFRGDFNMWGNINYDSGNYWWKNSVSEDIVRLLRDTIVDYTYVISATSGSAWHVPLAIKYNAPTDEDKQSLGSLDTLRTAFREYGSAMIDSIDGEGNYFMYSGWHSQYQSIGIKNAPIGSIEEGFNNTGDTLKMSGSIKRYYPSGIIKTNTIGKALAWENIIFTGNIETDYTSITVQVVGIKNTGDEDTLITVVNQAQIDLSQVDAMIYPELYLIIALDRLSFESEALLPENQAYITSIECNLTPAAELAIMKKETALDEYFILRGDDFNLEYEIENISPRNDMDTNSIRIIVGDNNLIDTNLVLNEIKAGEKENFNFVGITDYLEIKPNIYMNINDGNHYPEFYSFNNSDEVKFEILKDTLPPTIEVFCDGQPVEEASFVSIQPNMEIVISDSSALAITDSTYIHVFINGTHMPDDSTLSYKFTSYERGSYKKATINLVPPELIVSNTHSSIGTNSIRIEAQDASGNHSELFIRVNVSQATVFSDALSYPNPVTDDNADIVFDLRSKLMETKTEIKIFDIIGNLVKTIKHDAHNGINRIPWNCNNSNGNLVAPGIYFIHVTSIDKYWAEPIVGKFIIVR